MPLQRCLRAVTSRTEILRAAIFDLDGLLIDSEPLWQRVEQRVFGELGLALDSTLCQETTGLRIDEVVRHWSVGRRGAWPPAEEIVGAIVAGVIELIRGEGQAKPGIACALDSARAADLRLALASSSAPPIIEAALARLGLKGAFEVVHSASREPYGKPHPAVFLTTAGLLGISPRACIVLEDSLNGVIAAKAAQMRCVAVPEVPLARRAPFAVADAVVDSLEEVTLELLGALGASSYQE